MLRFMAATSVLLALSKAVACNVATAQKPLSLNEVRSAYRAACAPPDNSEVVTSFIHSSEQWVGTDSNDAFAKGLLAAARMIRAETLINPFEKLRIFNAQRKPLEAAITAAPNNPELRLLRLSIQWSIPFFLDYSDNMDEDLDHVTAALEGGYWTDDAEQEDFVLTFLQHINYDAPQR